jgi:hypothetical protein
LNNADVVSLGPCIVTPDFKIGYNLSVARTASLISTYGPQPYDLKDMKDDSRMMIGNSQLVISDNKFFVKEAFDVIKGLKKPPILAFPYGLFDIAHALSLSEVDKDFFPFKTVWKEKWCVVTESIIVELKNNESIALSQAKRQKIMNNSRRRVKSRKVCMYVCMYVCI